MPTRESKPGEPSFQPAGSGAALKAGWWCDDLRMRWDNAEADGKTGFDKDQLTAWRIWFMLRSNKLNGEER